MEATASLAFFAERYHWTQKQALAENQHWYLQRLPVVAAVLDEIREEKMPKPSTP